MHKRQHKARKSDILNAAIASFLHDGYSASNIDSIAQRAGVSKPTVYKHFDSKIDIFCKMIQHMVTHLGEEQADLSHARSLAPQEGLHFVAKSVIRKFYQEDLILLYRLVIGESRNFPEMGEALAQCFCDAAHQNVQDLLRHYVNTRQADIDDVDAATRQFMVLLEEPIISILFMRRDAVPGEKEQNEIVKHSVNMFWHYYKRNQS